MERYYFDSRDNGHFLADDTGFEFADLEDVKVQAAKALAELARDVIPGSLKRELSVEVRDERGPVLTVLMHFEAVVLREA